MQSGYTYIDGGFRVAICKEGRKWNQVVYIDGGTVRCRRTKERLTFRDCGIPMTKLAKRMLRKRSALGTKKVINKGAAKVLTEAAQT